MSLITHEAFFAQMARLGYTYWLLLVYSCGCAETHWYRHDRTPTAKRNPLGETEYCEGCEQDVKIIGYAEAGKELHGRKGSNWMPEEKP